MVCSGHPRHEEELIGLAVVQDGQILTGQVRARSSSSSSLLIVVQNPSSAEGVGKAIVAYLQKQK
jgi:hypothetical protein